MKLENIQERAVKFSFTEGSEFTNKHYLGINENFIPKWTKLSKTLRHLGPETRKFSFQATDVTNDFMSNIKYRIQMSHSLQNPCDG